MSHNDEQTRTMHGYERRADSSAAAIEEGREVKRFPLATGVPAEMLAHFTREATIVARLRHPHVAQVHVAGRLPDGTPYVVTERLRGRTLEEAMDAGPVPLADLVPILRGIASALSAAHAAGVVHGGLRADAVFLAEMPGYRWGFPKVLDFGVSRLGDAGNADAHADQRALVALAIRALGRPFSPAAQHVLERAKGWDARLPFASVTSFMETLEEALAIASVDAAPVAAAPPAATVAPVAAMVPAAAMPPSSLTQQFFADGERQELAHAVEGDDVEPDAPDASVARVPRNRAQIVTTTALTFGAVAIIVGTLVSLSTARDASPPAPVVVQRPADVPGSTSSAPADARTAAARKSGDPRPAHHERSHQGRTTPHRARHAEPPRFVPAPVPPAVAAQPVPHAAPVAVSAAPAAVSAPAASAGPAIPAPAAASPVAAAPLAAPEAPAPEAPAPVAAPAPPAQELELAPAPTAAGPDDTAAVNDDNVDQNETE
jgi:hypothetical protein